MERNNFCRTCKDNMRVSGLYSHSSVLFERRSKPLSVAERFLNIGLTLTADIDKSERICPRCVLSLTHIERILPVFREWEREFSGASSEPHTEKRPREATQSPEPRSSPVTTSPGGPLKFSGESITQVSNSSSTTRPSVSDADEEVKTHTTISSQTDGQHAPVNSMQQHEPEWLRLARKATTWPPPCDFPMPKAENTRVGVVEVVVYYPSKRERIVCPDDTGAIVEAIAKKRWNWAAKQIMGHAELLGPLNDNTLNMIEEECKKICSPDADFILTKTSAEDLKAFSLKKLHKDLQRIAPFLLSIFSCVSRRSENIACVAAAIALRGRQPRLSALSYFVSYILQCGGVRKRGLNSISKFGITVSYTSALYKRMELAMVSNGEDFDPLKLKITSETFLKEHEEEPEEQEEEEEEDDDDDDDDDEGSTANGACVPKSEKEGAEEMSRRSTLNVTVSDQSETMWDSPMQSTHENPSGMEQTTGVNTPSQRDQELESNEDTDAPYNIHPTHLKGRPDHKQYLKDLVYKCPCCKFSTELKIRFTLHMEFHINHALPFKEYVICRCHMPCRQMRNALGPHATRNAAHHFHCLFCPLTFVLKPQFALHLIYCSMPPPSSPASTHNDRPSNHDPLPSSAGATCDLPSSGTLSAQRSMRQHVSCQTDPPEISTVGTQLSIETFKPHCKTTETQTSVIYSDVCASTEPEMVERFPFDPYERQSKRPRLDLEEETENTLDSSSLMDIGETVTIKTESADLTTDSLTPSHKMSTYIVYESCLRELLTECPDCKLEMDVRMRRLGTFVTVHQHCQYCQYSRRWNSQPVSGSTPAGNLQLAAAIYINGASFTNIEQIFKTMNLKMFNYETFQRHARMYIEPAIVHKWRTTQDGLLAELSQQHLINLGGDMRTDLPGLTARFGSYTMMDLRNNKVIDIQLVQSSEVGANESMEVKGLGRSLALLKDHDVRPDTVVTEARPEIEEFLSEATFTHYYDVRHIEKGLSKKLQTLSHKKFFPRLKKWFPTIRKHLYWTAETSTTGPEREAKWRLLMKHIRNLHVHGDSQFPENLYTSRKPQKDPPKKLIDVPQALDELRMVLITEKILKDIWKLSPHPHTTSLEDFRSVSTRFTPKHVILPYQGRLCRLYLAALHFNENSGRPQATSADGEPLFRVAFPKSQTRECTDKPVKVEPTYRYAEELVDLVFDKVFPDPTPYVEEVLKIPRPPDVPSRFDQPCSQDVVSGYVSLINRGGRPPLY